MRKELKGLNSEEYPWAISMDKVRLYIEKPVVIDEKMRAQLDAFKGRDPEQTWAWFVQANRKISPHDFELLTGKGK